MKTWPVTVGVAALMAVSAAPLAAQAAPPTDAASTARVAMARTLVQTLKTEQQVRASAAKAVTTASDTFDRLVPMQVAMQAQMNDAQGFARAKEEAVKLIADDRRRLADETIPLIIDAEVRRYADHFTLDELKALNDFYRSPIGQRLIAEQPAMAAGSSQFQQNVLTPISNAHSAALGPRLAPLLAPILRPATTVGKKP